MLNSEEGCIRYLMREMDPAEEIEFEREMMKDENLLIEVESLRKTYKKLGKLPLQDPPKALLDDIKDKAIVQQRNRNERTKILMLNFSKAVASVAAALMIVSTAVYFYGGLGVQESEGSQSTVVQEGSEVVQPWVDRNEVIQFVGTSTQPNIPQSLENEMIQSFDKLKLVNSETGFSPPNRKIVLTSTSR